MSDIKNARALLEELASYLDAGDPHEPILVARIHELLSNPPWLALDWLIENGSGTLGVPGGWVDFSDKDTIRQELIDSMNREKKIKIIDQQGNEVRVGIAYRFSFGGPGPDVTTLVVTGINDEGTVDTYDVLFRMPVTKVKGDSLWRPLKHTWDAHPDDKKAVIDYAGESALSLE